MTSPALFLCPANSPPLACHADHARNTSADSDLDTALSLGVTWGTAGDARNRVINASWYLNDTSVGAATSVPDVGPVQKRDCGRLQPGLAFRF